MRWFTCCVFALLGCCFIGCGGGPTKPKTEIFPVAGAVRYKGAPLTDATLTFTPKGETLGFTGSARTDKDGKYSLIDMHGNKGMVAGEYAVTVSRRVMPGGAVVPAADKTPPIESLASESLPPHLSDSDRSKIVVRVTTEKSDYDLDLK